MQLRPLVIYIYNYIVWSFFCRSFSQALVKELMRRRHRWHLFYSPMCLFWNRDWEKTCYISYIRLPILNRFDSFWLCVSWVGRRDFGTGLSTKHQHRSGTPWNTGITRVQTVRGCSQTTSELFLDPRIGICWCQVDVTRNWTLLWDLMRRVRVETWSSLKQLEAAWSSLKQLEAAWSSLKQLEAAWSSLKQLEAAKRRRCSTLSDHGTI